jgi:putative CocE/NonD family hydrolase
MQRAVPLLSICFFAAVCFAQMPYRISMGVKIPLRDGVVLDATLFRPPSDAPVPVIVTLTPYIADRFEDVGAYFAKHGYAFAAIDDRGRGNSGGNFVLWTGEGRDGSDAIEWLARQPWCDGRAAMWGGSYGGKNQWMIAGQGPRALKTIVPASAGIAGQNIAMHNSNILLGLDYNWLVTLAGRTPNNSTGGDKEYWTGVYREISRGLVPYRHLDRLAGYESADWQRWMEHPALDAFWDAASTAPEDFARIAMPTLSITGAYDTSESGTIQFRQMQLDRAHAAESYLIIGPWDHPGSRVPKRTLGGLDFGEAAVIDVKALHVAWYDHVFKGAPLPAFLKDKVVYFLAGSNVWRSAPSVAAATARVQTVYLASSSGRGALAEKAEAPGRDRYTYDPGLPAHNEGFEGGDYVSPSYLTDDGMIRRIAGDGLIYDSAPLPVAANLVGTPALTLEATLDVPDTDFRAVLYEAKADGSVVFLTQDLLRARYRKSLRQAELVTPGKVENYRFDHFNFIARTLAAGSCVRLVLVPVGASYHAQRNRNSGKPVQDETAADNRIAHVEILLGAKGSHLDLPWGR